MLARARHGVFLSPALVQFAAHIWTLAPEPGHLARKP
jgi:hypothetical protein